MLAIEYIPALTLRKPLLYPLSYGGKCLKMFGLLCSVSFVKLVLSQSLGQLIVPSLGFGTEGIYLTVPWVVQYDLAGGAVRPTAPAATSARSSVHGLHREAASNSAC